MKTLFVILCDITTAGCFTTGGMLVIKGDTDPEVVALVVGAGGIIASIRQLVERSR